MMSTFVSQLKMQNALERLPEVFAEIPRVREDLGYPPLVTPTSQIVGSQAVLNVLAGKYKLMTNELRAYMKGSYGAAPGPLNEALRKKTCGNQELVTCRPADNIKPQLEQARKDIDSSLHDDTVSEEDVLSYVMFPLTAEQFFKDRSAAKL